MEEQPHSIKKWEHSPGIHFEKLEETRLYNKAWDLITLVKLDSFRDKYDQIRRYKKLTESYCLSTDHFVSQYVDIVCQFLNNTASHTLKRIEYDLDQLEQLVDTKPQRSKRAWFDILGRGAKVLFGVLDQDDANYYNAKISDFDKHERDTLELVKQQTKVVQTTINNFNETISSLNFNEKLLTENLIKIKNNLNDDSKVINVVKLVSLLNEHVYIFSSLMHELQLEIMTLNNAILDANQGSLNPNVMSPQRLAEELSSLLDHLPRGLEFPVPCDVDHMHILMNLITLKVYIQNHQLVYVIKIPLLEPQIYYLYKINHLPTKLEDLKFVMLEPTTKYLAVNETGIFNFDGRSVRKLRESRRQ